MYGSFAQYAAQEQFHNTEDHAQKYGVVSFERAYRHGVFRRIGWALMHRQSKLLALSEVQKTIDLHSRRYAGLQIVSIDLIRGSEGRSDDFDREFAPRREHVRGRWVKIAMARKQGVTLPPVDLIRVGNVYFVRDGHHRISVARARGETFIDAEVIDWVPQHTNPAA